MNSRQRPTEAQIKAVYCAEVAPLVMTKEPPWRFIGHHANGLEESFADRDIVSLGKKGLLRVCGKIAKITPTGEAALKEHRGALIAEINQLAHGDNL